MNIFLIHLFTKKCANLHIDLHVRKMIIEYAQLLCTAHRFLDGNLYLEIVNKRKTKRWKLDDEELESTLYKSTHINHPCAIWVRESIINYAYLYQLFVDLCNEYTYRFGKVHMTENKLKHILKTPPKNIPIKYFTKFPLAMPDCYKTDDPIKSYRLFYRGSKRVTKAGKKMDIWSNRPVPDFMN